MLVFAHIGASIRSVTLTRKEAQRVSESEAQRRIERRRRFNNRHSRIQYRLREANRKDQPTAAEARRSLLDRIDHHDITDMRGVTLSPELPPLRFDSAPQTGRHRRTEQQLASLQFETVDHEQGSSYHRPY